LRKNEDQILNDVLQQMVSLYKGGLRDTLLLLRTALCNVELTVCNYQDKRVILSTVSEDNINQVQKTAASVKNLGKKCISMNRAKNMLLRKANRIHIGPGICMVTIFPIFYGDELCYFLIAESHQEELRLQGWNIDNKLLKLLGVGIRLHCLETAKEQVLDRLTGLPLRDDLTRFIYGISKASKELSLHFSVIQLSNLQQLNDEYGYSFGDEALKKTAFCLKKYFPVNIYRVSGKKFLIIRQGNVHDVRSTLENVLTLLRKLDSRYVFSVAITPVYDNPFYALSVCERSMKRTDIEAPVIVRECDADTESENLILYPVKEDEEEMEEEKMNGENRDGLSFEEKWRDVQVSFQK